ncbi:MAG: heat-inducible transcriptional repressor HrcA [Clostridiales bacterium]|jgi:heat-inducible transcriptional repressor|nr:heat-inducible transcriptional repressor HrcA [Clostridiales bacterium]MCI2161936.1 heat-inducible transcriptional repressor HrcA [Oscillospiraceae bacterium]MCI1962127.1 heat-inducible transcriptional repressor HrcA [Clostridiales bacterium]MCI2022569.1 heat-inducible transcriptional repressor HrcA [Clostridiales bacterium]MCI2027116.1 heat-inducible transcriptional repressor HrcA [Clostridiales bacterium]
MELSPRKQKILTAVIELYTETGEPVGSKVLCEMLEFPVSSATVRNEMSELSAMGLLEQPHTSAGRVPSEAGYRFYLDSLIEPESTTPDERHFIDALLLPSAYDPEKLLDGVSRALSGMTRLAAISITPSGRDAVVRAVQFVQTSRRTSMVILMTSNGTMHTRVFHCEFDLSPEILRVFFRVFNEKLVNMPIRKITPAFIQSLAASMGDVGMLMSSALMALLEVAREAMGADVRMDGETNLLYYPEVGEGDLRRVMGFLARQDEVYRLLIEPGDRVLIGKEIGVPALDSMALIISHYAINGTPAGAIALLGPMRMNYKRLLGSLSYLSDSVGRMLTELMKLQ